MIGHADTNEFLDQVANRQISLIIIQTAIMLMHTKSQQTMSDSNKSGDCGSGVVVGGWGDKTMASACVATKSSVICLILT